MSNIACRQTTDAKIKRRAATVCPSRRNQRGLSGALHPARSTSHLASGGRAGYVMLILNLSC